MIELFSFQLSHSDIGLLILVAVFIGMAKTGVHGTGLMAVPLLALVFGGKSSSGIMLPILIFADFFGVRYYHRHAEFHHLKKLVPFALVGIVSGTIFGEYIDDVVFRQAMAFIIFVSLGLMIWMEQGDRKVPGTFWFSALIGIIGGFTSMVGNLAGSVMAIYLLSMRLPKNNFIGTAAWFFLTVNLLKVPFHIWSWKTISLDSFLLNVTLIPAIGLGAFLGVWVVQKIPEKIYRLFIIAMTAVAAVFMLI